MDDLFTKYMKAITKERVEPLNNIKCEVVQDLLALYAEGEVNQGTRNFIETHLKECEKCREAFDGFTRPIISVAQPEYETSSGHRAFLLKAKRVFITVALVVLTASISLASASYYAGRHIAMRDPDFDMAREKGLFTEVNSTQKLGNMDIILDQVLFDSTRTTLFYYVEPGLDDFTELEMEMKGSDGTIYNRRSTRGFDNRIFVAEFEPVQSETEEVEVLFTQQEIPFPAVFNVKVDYVKIAEATREIRPELTKDINGIRIDLDRFSIGASSTVVDFRAIWDLDKGIRGIGFGLDRPIGAVMGSDGAKSAETRFINYRPVPAGTPMTGRIALIDQLNRREIMLQGCELQTDSLSGGVNGTLTFEPLKSDTDNLKLLMPPLYVYSHVESQGVAEGETLDFDGVKLTVADIKKDDKQLIVSYTISGNNYNGMPQYLPEFVVIDKANPSIERQGDITLDQSGGQVCFHISEGDWEIGLKSLGKCNGEDLSFDIDVQAL
jgi:hypothetical protein